MLKGQTERLWFRWSLVIVFLVTIWGFPVIAPRERNQEEKYREPHQPSTKVAAPISTEERLTNYTEALAWWTAIIAITAMGQGYFLIRADKTARISANAAKKSADAAERALTDIEAPLVYLVDVGSIQSIFQYFELYNHPTSAVDPVSPEVSFFLKNYGRSPAILHGITASLTHLSGDPTDELDDLLQSSEVDLVLAAHEKGTKRYRAKIVSPIDKVAYQSIKMKNSRLYLHGTVYFSELNGTRWEQPFLLTWNPESKSFAPWGERGRKKAPQHQS